MLPSKNDLKVLPTPLLSWRACNKSAIVSSLKFYWNLQVNPICGKVFVITNYTNTCRVMQKKFLARLIRFIGKKIKHQKMTQKESFSNDFFCLFYLFFFLGGEGGYQNLFVIFSFTPWMTERSIVTFPLPFLIMITCVSLSLFLGQSN